MDDDAPGHVDRNPTAAEALARRLDKPMGALGLLFLLVVLGQVVADDPRLSSTLTTVSTMLWLVFVAEFALRAYVARDQRRFWSRNWWQVIFLAVPFLRFARALALVRVTRVARAGSVLSAAVRGSRSAGRLLTSRIAWLSIVTSLVMLAASQLLYVLGSYDNYAEALHAAALATITGEPLSATDGFARFLEVVLAIYSVIVFAGLAGALGAYFLRREPAATGDPGGDPPR